MPKHLLINPACDAPDWLSLCGDNSGQFTTDFNQSTCPDCIDLELFYVHNTEPMHTSELLETAV
jgi:hypothetical protein